MATASRKPRPGLTLIIFLLAIGAMFGIMSVSGTWSPKLGLDLQGGTTVTLTATNSTVEKKSLELAKSIIRSGLTGLGSVRPRWPLLVTGTSSCQPPTSSAMTW